MKLLHDGEGPLMPLHRKKVLLGTTSSTAELRLLCSAKNAYIGRKRSYVISTLCTGEEVDREDLGRSDVDTEAARLTLPGAVASGVLYCGFTSEVGN